MIMDAQKNVHVIIATLVLSVLLCENQARLFKVQNPDTNKTCIIVDIDFRADIKAIKNNRVIASKTLTSDDKGISSGGICDKPLNEMLVIFGGKTFWSLFFVLLEDQPHAVAQYRYFGFLPVDIFGQSVNVSTQQVFNDPRPVYQAHTCDSFYCQIKDEIMYKNSQAATGDFSFHVNVTVSFIQSQGFYIKNDQFGPPEKCQGSPSL